MGKGKEGRGFWSGCNASDSADWRESSWAGPDPWANYDPARLGNSRRSQIRVWRRIEEGEVIASPPPSNAEPQIWTPAEDPSHPQQENQPPLPAEPAAGSARPTETVEQRPPPPTLPLQAPPVPPQLEEAPAPRRPRCREAEVQVLEAELPLAPQDRKFALSYDAFDCPICTIPMIGRILQCLKGHGLCQACFSNLAEKTCPSCKTGYAEEPARNWALEALAAQCSFPCRFGCGLEAKPEPLSQHLLVCTKAPISCVISGCNHECTVAEMAEHLKTIHVADQKVQVLRDRASLGLTSTQIDKSAVWRPQLLLSGDQQLPKLLLQPRLQTGGAFSIKVLHFTAKQTFTVTLSGTPPNCHSITSQSVSIREDAALEDQVFLCAKAMGKLWKWRQEDESPHYRVELMTSLKE